MQIRLMPRPPAVPPLSEEPPPPADLGGQDLDQRQLQLEPRNSEDLSAGERGTTGVEELAPQRLQWTEVAPLAPVAEDTIFEGPVELEGLEGQLSGDFEVGDGWGPPDLEETYISSSLESEGLEQPAPVRYEGATTPESESLEGRYAAGVDFETYHGNVGTGNEEEEEYAPAELMRIHGGAKTNRFAQMEAFSCWFRQQVDGMTHRMQLQDASSR